MEQEHHQWVADDDEQEDLQGVALEGRKSLQHRKESILNGEIVAPSSPTGICGGHSDGVCSASEEEPLINIQKEQEEEVEDMNNVVEINGNYIHFNDEHAAVGLGLLAEFVGSTTNGEAINSANITIAASENKNSVYFDKQEGNELNGLEGVQNGDGARPVLTKSHGVVEADIQAENSDTENNPCNKINNQWIESETVSKLSPLQSPSKVQGETDDNFGNESRAKAGPELIEDSDQQLKELDVEAVLAKQETHDLFCPNCKSCITKRVILKKRKRNPHNLETNAKRDKADNSSSVHEVNQDSQTIVTSGVNRLEPPADNHEPEREQEVFRCLSCFSIFIPIRNGIKLLLKPETSQNPVNLPASNLENPSNVAPSNENWFFSLFDSNKGKKAGEKGDASIENSRIGSLAEQHPITSRGSLADTPISNNINLTPDIKPGHGGMLESVINAESRIENGIKSNTVSVNESLADQKKNDSVAMINTDTVANNPSMIISDDMASKGGKQCSGVDATVSSDKDIEEEINSVRKEKNESDASRTSQTADNVPIKGAIVTESHTEIFIGEEEIAEIGEPREWEILKSIVYGGLIESITSLGIVSSAAASGAAPLNIIAMGVANLISGLFIIGHNLTEIKNGDSGGDPQQEDRYQEQLGKRANFPLHAVVAVLSFLIFGLVPIVVYGLLIRMNYYAEVKLAIVAATSIVCIILLAIGKVYTTRPPKSYVKTVLRYVSLALAASGVSYVVGDLLNNLLQKFNGSDSGLVLTMPFSGTRRMEPAWMSY